MKEVVYILQTKALTLDNWIDTAYTYKNRPQAKVNLISYRKTALEIGSTNIFRIIKQTRQAIYEGAL